MEPQTRLELNRWEPLYKRRALPFIDQGEGRVTMWDKSRDTWDPLSRVYCHSAP